jgi:hypothetical protein
VSATDSFTDANGTALDAHTGEGGVTWAKHVLTAAAVDIQGNRVRWIGPDDATYLAVPTPEGADYTASVVAYVHSAIAETFIGPVVRSQADGSMYRAYLYYDGSAWGVHCDKIGATYTYLGGATPATPAPGTSHTITLAVSGSTITASLDGSPYFSTTDTEITAAGRVGFFTGRTAMTATTGVHGDSFTTDAFTVVAPGGSVTLAGALKKTVAVALEGAFAATLQPVVVGGTLTPAGALKKTVARHLAGEFSSTGHQVLVESALTPTGTVALARTLRRATAGTLAPSGGLTKTVRKPLEGGFVTTGTQVYLGGNLALAGGFSTHRVGLLARSGALGPAGALRRRVGKVLDGAFTSIGVQVFAGGALTLGGALGTVLTPGGHEVFAQGTLATGGAVRKSTRLGLGGTFGGGAAYGLSFSGTLTTTGALRKLTARSLTGRFGGGATDLLTLAGALTTHGVLGAGTVRVTTAGALVPAGALGKRVGLHLGGVFGGGETALIGLGGALTTSGGIARALAVALTGRLDTNGQVVGKAEGAVLLGAGLPTAGALRQDVARSFAGTLTGAGSVGGPLILGRQFAGTLTGAGTLQVATLGGLQGRVLLSGTRSGLATLRPSGLLIPQGLLLAARVVQIVCAGTLAPTATLIARPIRVIRIEGGPLVPTGALLVVRFFAPPAEAPEPPALPEVPLPEYGLLPEGAPPEFAALPDGLPEFLVVAEAGLAEGVARARERPPEFGLRDKV